MPNTHRTEALDWDANTPLLVALDDTDFFFVAPAGGRIGTNTRPEAPAAWHEFSAGESQSRMGREGVAGFVFVEFDTAVAGLSLTWYPPLRTHPVNTP